MQHICFYTNAGWRFILESRPVGCYSNFERGPNFFAAVTTGNSPSLLIKAKQPTVHTISTYQLYHILLSLYVSSPAYVTRYVKITSEEKRAEERLLYASMYDNVRRAAEVHRQVRRYAQSFIKPGIKLIDMCTMLEEKVGRRGWPALVLRELWEKLFGLSLPC